AGAAASVVRPGSVGAVEGGGGVAFLHVGHGSAKVGPRWWFVGGRAGRATGQVGAGRARSRR
ncbi:hypothetical protein DF186_18825, partial [Enterococcus hirae]